MQLWFTSYEALAPFAVQYQPWIKDMKKKSILLAATIVSVFSLSAWAQQPNADTTVVTEKAPGKAMLARSVTLLTTRLYK